VRAPRLTLADAAALATRTTRTRALRLGGAGLVLVILAAAFLAAHRAQAGEPRLVPPGKTTVLVLDVSSSVQPAVFRQVDATLARAIRQGGRFGLVVFSDVAYELMPPGTPAAELQGVRRYYAPVGASFAGPTVAVGSTRYPASPWLASFTSGTKLSTGLDLAREILRRDHVRDGAVLLVSDLDDDFLDLPALARVLEGYAHDRLPLKIEALSATPANVTLFRRLLQGHGSVREAPPAAEDVARTSAVPHPSFPAWLAALGVVLAAALALNEHLCARLPLRAGEGGS